MQKNQNFPEPEVLKLVRLIGKHLSKNSHKCKESENVHTWETGNDLKLIIRTVSAHFQLVSISMTDL